MDPQYERLHDPAYPLPQRQPWETFQTWGMPPERPDRSQAAHVSPGPPPWADPPERRMPVWAMALIVLAVLALCVGCSWALFAPVSIGA